MLAAVLLASSCELTPFDTLRKGNISLYWTIPSSRLNGESLAVSDIGGYIVRLSNRRYSFFETYRINNPRLEKLQINDVPLNGSELEIATFDNSGRQSPFIRVDLP